MWTNPGRYRSRSPVKRGGKHLCQRAATAEQTERLERRRFQGEADRIGAGDQFLAVRPAPDRGEIVLGQVALGDPQTEPQAERDRGAVAARPGSRARCAGRARGRSRRRPAATGARIGADRLLHGPARILPVVEEVGDQGPAPPVTSPSSQAWRSQSGTCRSP